MDCLLLATPAMMDNPLCSLPWVFWKVEPIVASLVSDAHPRFDRLLYKLRAWDLDRYAKVCLLDTDILLPFVLMCAT